MMMETTRTLLVLLLLFSLYPLIGQKFYWAEEDAPRSYTTARILATEVDSENNVVVFGTCGISFSNQEMDIQNDSIYNYFLAKYNELGELIWFEAIGSDSFLSTNYTDVGLAIGPENDIYLGASIPYQGSLNIQGSIVAYSGTGSSSNKDFFITRYNSDGLVEMVMSQGADNATLNDLSVDDLGNIYAAGSYSGELTFEQTHTSSGGFDAFLVKLDVDGTPIWSRSEGNASNSDRSFSVVYSEGSVYWGYYLRAGSGPVDYTTRVRKVTEDNINRWVHDSYGSDSGFSNSGSDIAVFEDNVYLIGQFDESLSFDGTTVTLASSNDQVFVLKLRDNGATCSFLWAEQRGGSGFDIGYSVDANNTNVFISLAVSSDAQIQRLSADGGGTLATLVNDHPMTTGSSYAHGMVLSDIGDIFFAGWHTGNLKYGEYFLASGGVFLARTSGFLDELSWLKGNYSSSFEAKTNAHDNEGNMYVAGQFFGEFKDEQGTLIGRGGTDVYFRKYDQRGNVIFNRLLTSFRDDYIGNITIFDEHIYITGTFDADDGSVMLDVGEGSLISGDEYREVFLAKYDLDGSLVYAKTVVSSEGDLDVHDIGINRDGEVYLVGNALTGSPKNFGNGVIRSFADYGYFLAKYDNDGLAQWAEMVDDTRGAEVDVRPDGEVVVGGTFDSDIDFNGTGLINSGSNDIFIATYDRDGTFQWVKNAGGTGNDFLSGLSFGNTGDEIFFSGNYYGNFSIESENLVGERDEIFFGNYQHDGTLHWVRSAGGPRRDYNYGLSVDTTGNPYFICKYEGSATFDTQTFEGIGIYDIQALIIGYDADLGTIVHGSEFGHPTNYEEGDDDDVFNSMSIDAQNNYYLTGDFIDEVALDTILLEGNGNNSYFATKMSLSDCAYLGSVDFSFSGNSCGSDVLFTDLTDLGAHTIDSWLWDFGDGNTSALQNPSHAYGNAGDYLVSLTVNYNGGFCGAFVQRPMAISLSNSVNAGEDQIVCHDQVVALEGGFEGGTTAITWVSLGDGNFSDATNTTSTYNLGANDIGAGFVQLVIASSPNACEIARDTLLVSIQSMAPEVNTLFREVSVPSETILNLDDENPNSPSGDFVILNEPKKGEANLSGQTLTYQVGLDQVGRDTVAYQSIGGCGSSNVAYAIFDILNEPPFITDRSEVSTMGGTVTIEPSAHFGDVNGNLDWTTFSVQSNTFLARASATMGASGELVIDYSNNGFSGMDQIELRVCDTYEICVTKQVQIDVEPLSIEVYNAITPNGDAQHDFLKINNIENFGDNTLSIFNRTGNLVFYVEGYDNETQRFEGIANRGSSEELADGTYFYELNLKSLGSVKSGFLLINR